MLPKIKARTNGSSKKQGQKTNGQQQEASKERRSQQPPGGGQEVVLWPGKQPLIQQVLTLHPTEEATLIDMIQSYTNFMKKEINKDKATWTALEKEHFQRSHHIFKLQQQEDALKATLKVCSNPGNKRLQGLNAKEEFQKQDNTIQYLEEQVQALRAQIADGKASTVTVLKQARQHNSDLAAELQSSHAAIQQQAKEIKRAQAELRRTQMAIARKHPQLGVYAALAAEEEAFEQAEQQAAIEAAQPKKPAPSKASTIAAAVCPHTAAPQPVTTAPAVPAGEARVMLCLLVQPP